MPYCLHLSIILYPEIQTSIPHNQQFILVCYFTAAFFKFMALILIFNVSPSHNRFAILAAQTSTSTFVHQMVFQLVHRAKSITITAIFKWTLQIEILALFYMIGHFFVGQNCCKWSLLSIFIIFFRSSIFNDVWWLGYHDRFALLKFFHDFNIFLLTDHRIILFQINFMSIFSVRILYNFLASLTEICLYMVFLMITNLLIYSLSFNCLIILR